MDMRFLYSLLCVALFMASEARASVAGQGWYLVGQVGVGVVVPTVDGDEFVQNRLKRLLKSIGVESSWFPWPGAQLLWGI